MFFQGRGKVYVAVRDANGAPGAFKEICPDSFSLALATDSFEHTNKCGPVDVVDYRGTKSSSGTLTFSFADQSDRNFAIGVLGNVTTAEGSPGTVSAEVQEGPWEVGDSMFLGGVEGHRAITSLVITDNSTSPGSPLTLNTDYTLDAASGRVVFLTAQDGPVSNAYSHTDPQSVSLLSGAQPEYFVRMEFLNKADANNPGSLELYRVRFDPVKTLDLLSDELSVIELDGSVLADLTRSASDTEFGQFGRRVL